MTFSCFSIPGKDFWKSNHNFSCKCEGRQRGELSIGEKSTVSWLGLVHWFLYLLVDQTLVNALHGLLNYDIGRLDCCVITTEFIKQVHWIHMYCNALVCVIYSVVSTQYSYTILACVKPQKGQRSKSVYPLSLWVHRFKHRRESILCP